jgi:hypothetical protein
MIFASGALNCCDTTVDDSTRTACRACCTRRRSVLISCPPASAVSARRMRSQGHCGASPALQPARCAGSFICPAVQRQMCWLKAESLVPAALENMTAPGALSNGLEQPVGFPEACAKGQGCSHSREDLVGFARADNLESRSTHTHADALLPPQPPSAAASRFRTLCLPPVSGRSTPGSREFALAACRRRTTSDTTMALPYSRPNTSPVAQFETKTSHGKFQIVARLATCCPWRHRTRNIPRCQL